jgi:hypothetical protein
MADLMNLQIIAGGGIISPNSPFYNPTANTDVNISAADRLTVGYDGTSMNYYVNGVIIHTVAATGITVGTTELYGAITLQNNPIAADIKQCAVVDFQMGPYDKGSMPSFIIGGRRKNGTKKSNRNSVFKTRRR